MDSKEFKLEEYLEAFIKETQEPVTIEELKRYSKYFPLFKEGEQVGVVGMDVVDTEHLGLVAVIKILYLEPRARGNFRELIKYIFSQIDTSGITHLELHCNHKISRWFRRALRHKPTSYIHFGETKDFLSRIGE